ncbi:unnamed protein product, partial [Ixodes pacificus]
MLPSTARQVHVLPASTAATTISSKVFHLQWAYLGDASRCPIQRERPLANHPPEFINIGYVMVEAAQQLINRWLPKLRHSSFNFHENARKL